MPFEQLQQIRIKSIIEGNSSFSESREANYQTLRKQLVQVARSLRFREDRIATLTDHIKSLNQKIISADSRMIQHAYRARISRREFVEAWYGNELDTNWIESLKGRPGRSWSALAEKSHLQLAAIQAEYIEVANHLGITIREFRRTATMVFKGEKEARQAKDELVRANLNLVIGLARKFTNRGIHLLDLIQEGIIGLMNAVDKFDFRRGYKFSTYAVFWIRQSIARSISDQSRIIRIPVHMIEIINKVTRTKNRLKIEFGREPTPAEIALKLRIPLEQVQKAIKIAKEPISLETPVGNEEGSFLGDFIEDKDSMLPLDCILQRELKNTTANVLSSLTPREEHILRMRFGIGLNSDHTLEEVGQKFNVTRERIRQIEVKALKKLKDPNLSEKLKPFLDE